MVLHMFYNGFASNILVYLLRTADVHRSFSTPEAKLNKNCNVLAFLKKPSRFIRVKGY